MKLFLALLLIVGGYYFVLCETTQLAVNQTASLQQQYSNVSATANKWAAGDTSASFSGN